MYLRLAERLHSSSQKQKLFGWNILISQAIKTFKLTRNLTGHEVIYLTAFLSLKHLALSGFSFDIKRSTELPLVCGVCFCHYQGHRDLLGVSVQGGWTRIRLLSLKQIRFFSSHACSRLACARHSHANRTHSWHGRLTTYLTTSQVRVVIRSLILRSH